MNLPEPTAVVPAASIWVRTAPSDAVLAVPNRSVAVNVWAVAALVASTMMRTFMPTRTLAGNEMPPRLSTLVTVVIGIVVAVTLISGATTLVLKLLYSGVQLAAVVGVATTAVKTPLVPPASNPIVLAADD